MWSAVIVAIAASVIGCGEDDAPESPKPARPAPQQAARDPGPPQEVIRAPERGCMERAEGRLPEDWREASVVVGPLILPNARRLASRDWGPRAPDRLPVKLIALVAPGERVVLRVPPGERERVELNYGDTPRAREVIALEACERSFAATLGAPHTQFTGGFWITEPTCATLEVWLPRRAKPIRRRLPLGTPCDSSQPRKSESTSPIT